MTDLSISERVFEKKKKEAKEEYLKEGEDFSEEELNKEPSYKTLTFNEKVIEEPAFEYCDVEDDGTISFAFSNDLYYFDSKLILTDDDFCKLISIAIKRLNKFKNVLESLK